MISRHVLVLAGIACWLSSLVPCRAEVGEDPPPWEAQAEKLDLEADEAVKQGQLPEAEQKMRTALSLRQASLGGQAPELAVSQYRLARLLAQLHQDAEAEALYLAAIDIWEQAGPDFRRELAIGLNHLGALYIGQGQLQEAEPLYRRGWDVLSQIPDADPLDLARAHNNMGFLEYQLAHYTEAEAAFRSALEAKEKLRISGADLAQDLNNLAEVYRAQARWKDAESLYRRALELFRTDKDQARVALMLSHLALLDADQAHYLEAEKGFREAIALLTSDPSSDPLDLARQWSNLSGLLVTLARFQEAEPLARQALEKRRELLGEVHPDVAASLELLAKLLKEQGRYSDAEPLYRQSLEILKRTYGDSHPEVAHELNNLGDLQVRQGRYSEAESLYKSAFAIYEKALSPSHPWVATSLDNLAALAKLQGHPREAVELLERSRDLHLAHGDDDGLATVLNNLGTLYKDQGQLAEAILTLRQALGILERVVGRDHPHFATSLENLASIESSQGRLSQAETLYRQAQEILERSLGPDHPDVATTLSNLGSVVLSQGRLPEAKALFERLVAIREKSLGPLHPDVAAALDSLAAVAFVRSEDAEAESLLRRSLDLRRRVLGPDHPEVAESLSNLGFLLFLQGRAAESEELVEGAIRILEQVPAYPEQRVNVYGLRARLRKGRGDREGALRALEQALEIAEHLRPRVGGSEETKAVFLAKYEDLYHEMVGWQLESGRIGRALESAEHRRSRVLLDQLALARVDWRTGIPEELRSSLLQREARSLAHLSELQQRVRSLAGKIPPELAASLREEERGYTELYEEMRNASSLWQRAAGQGAFRLAAFQKKGIRPRELVLLYELGEKDSFLFLIPPAGQRVRVFPLKVSQQSAEALGISPGALTAEDVERILLGDPREKYREERPGLLVELAGPGRGGEQGDVLIFDDQASPAEETLRALWEVLVPKELRRQLAATRPVLIVPDGALHFLPFEALIVGQRRGSPLYWIDREPVVLYEPSLMALQSFETPSTAPRAGATATDILSLSDPVFQSTETDLRADSSDRPASFFADGPLGRLSGTVLETEEILSAFDRRRVQVLEGAGATEEALRKSLAGKRYLHLATHGLVDEEAGNLFAMLALAPPQEVAAPPDNDGFLQLHEIYGLDLSSCELAVLSACRTNIGRSIRGEGVFALSRGVMVAGARRVIASQWSVNDASTAELIRSLFRKIGAAEKVGAVDYAVALRDARRKVREQRKWSAPRYWAPFVLIGAR